MLSRFRRYLRSLGHASNVATAEPPSNDTREQTPPGEISDPRLPGFDGALTEEAQEEARHREAIETLVGLKVGNLKLYDRALSHRSLLRRKKDSRQYSNERLEFLGDAVLGFVVAEHLYRHFGNEDEGFLTRLRAKLVNGEALADAAREMNLGPAIRVSENMLQKGGRDNTSVLSDAFEAVIGALYLDLGIDAARDFVHRRLLDEADMDFLAVHRDNYKSLLLEHVQAKGWPQPTYELHAEEGPSHNRVFTVDVIINGISSGRGTANSKKKAEQQAAQEALNTLRTADETDAVENTNRVTGT